MNTKNLLVVCCLTLDSCSLKLGRHTFSDKEFEEARSASNVAFELEGHYPAKFDRKNFVDLSLGEAFVDVKSDGDNLTGYFIMAGLRIYFGD